MRHAHNMNVEARQNLHEEQILNHKKLTYICNRIKKAVAKGKITLCLDFDDDEYYRVNSAELIYLNLYGYRVGGYWWGIKIIWGKS
jgi:hypothetical protein